MEIDELRKLVRQGKLDRSGLIRALRKVRMAAIREGDEKKFAFFGVDPVEVVADRMIAEERRNA